MTNVVTPYLRVVLRLTDFRLEVEWPITALGLVAVRRTSFQAPLTEVRSIRLTHLVAPGRLALALVLALVGPFVGLPPASRL